MFKDQVREFRVGNRAVLSKSIFFLKRMRGWGKAGNIERTHDGEVIKQLANAVLKRPQTGIIKINECQLSCEFEFTPVHDTGICRAGGLVSRTAGQRHVHSRE